MAGSDGFLPIIYIRNTHHVWKKRYQKLVRTYSLASHGTYFVKFGQAGEVGQRSKHIGLDTSTYQTQHKLIHIQNIVIALLKHSLG